MKGVGCGVRSAALRRCEDKPGGNDLSWPVKQALLGHGSGDAWFARASRASVVLKRARADRLNLQQHLQFLLRLLVQ
jgi:hypothetical protein